MSISFELPPGVEKSLRSKVDNLEQAAKEGALVELYRQDKLSHYQLGQALGISRFEVDGVLKRHGVYYDITAEDVIRETEALSKDLEK